MGIPVCSVCGLSCGEYCVASDEFGNPVDGWMHILCKAKETSGSNPDCFGSLASTGILKQKKATMQQMRIPVRRVGAPVRSPLLSLQGRTLEIHKGKRCHRL